MKTYIALLRGINLGSKNRVAMRELTAILEELGAANVRTYIQSGNVVFERSPAGTKTLPEKLGAAIKSRCGFLPKVILLSHEQLELAIVKNPFPDAEDDPTGLHFSFFEGKPEKPNLEKLENLKATDERFHLSDGVFYLHAPAGVGRSKLAASAEKLLGVAMTDRNWRTVCRLREMAGEPGKG